MAKKKVKDEATHMQKLMDMFDDILSADGESFEEKKVKKFFDHCDCVTDEVGEEAQLNAILAQFNEILSKQD